MYPQYEWEYGYDGEEMADFLDEEDDSLEWESGGFHGFLELWRSIPSDMRSMLLVYARNMWMVRSSILPLLITKAYDLVRWQRFTPYAAIQQAGRQLGLRPRARILAGKPGMSPVQVRAYIRRRRQKMPRSRSKRRYSVRRY